MYDPFVLNWFIKALDRWSGRQEVTHLTPAKTEVWREGGSACMSVSGHKNQEADWAALTNPLSDCYHLARRGGRDSAQNGIVCVKLLLQFLQPTGSKTKIPLAYFNHFKTKSSVWMNYWANSSPSKPQWLQFTSTFTQERRGRSRFTMGWSVCLPLMHIHEE